MDRFPTRGMSKGGNNPPNTSTKRPPPPKGSCGEDNPWKSALIDALVVSCVYQKEHENNPKKALNDLMVWEQRVVMDPAVSSEAKKLHDAIDTARDIIKRVASVGVVVHENDFIRVWLPSGTLGDARNWLDTNGD